MTSPTLEMQAAIVARLTNDSALTALINKRVFDRVPEDSAFPYVSLGPTQEIAEDAECIDADEVHVQIDAWSREVGYPEVRKIADAVRKALDDYAFTLTANALVAFEYRQTRTMRDPDGVTNHAVIEFTAIIERK